MNYNIKITKTANSRLSEIDFENIPFGREFTDHMFEADYANGEWTNFEIKPFHYLQVHPGNLAWHYGQSIFEGMKASKDVHGRAMLFRPEKHAARFNNSARRMSMPEFPEDLFVEALHKLIGVDQAWIPPQEGSAMYIRPFMIAMDSSIGVKASSTYKMIVLLLPVGPYYSKPVSLKVEQEYVRAVRGGVGEAKTAGNYAAALLPTYKAIAEGYSQVMWMDAEEFKYVQEVGTMNIFFVIGDQVITPATDGAILKGITRDSIMTILRDEGYDVVEKKLSIDEIAAAYKAGELKEIFGSGTAAVVAEVDKLAYKELVMDLSNSEYKVARFAKDYINKLRRGLREDKYGWTVPVREQVLVG
jgi:branched-chain amino acid aminotransferase